MSIKKHYYILAILFFSFIINEIDAQAGFSANVTSGCAPLVVSFTYTGGGSPTNLSWDFGNGVTLSGDPAVEAQLLNPSIIYNSAGSYTVSLSVTTSSGTENYVETGFITVYEDPEVDFSANVQEGCGSFPVLFTDLSTSEGSVITSWNWDFGDGGSSTLQNPTHVYNTVGVFDVSLSVTNQNGCNSVYIIEDYITSTAGVTPLFEIDQSFSCNIPTVITITNLSTGEGELTYLWDFGNTETSTSTDPGSVTYDEYGYYVISLTLSNDLGCTQYYSQIVSIQEYQVNFDYQLSCLPAPSLFINTSDPEMNVFEWDFGDPTSSSNTSILPTASHLFTGPGTYTVTLTASIDGDCESSTSFEVTIDEAEEIEYELESTFVCEFPASIPITINNSNVESWSWYLSYTGGDLFDSGNQINNVIEFDDSNMNIEEGSYTLVLSVTYSNGCTAFLSLPGVITVDIPEFDLAVYPTNICVGDAVYAENLSDFVSDFETETWAWGDGSYDYTTVAEHVYNEAGDYELVFTITTEEGCSKDTTIEIQVGLKTEPDFTYSDTTVCIEEEVQFFYTGSGMVDGYYWYYNGLSVSSAASPLISIDNVDSTHVISLITTNNGCRDTVEYTVDIIGLGPKANFFADEAFYCKEEFPWISSISNVTDSTPNTIYQWAFADSYFDSTTAFTPGDLEFLDPGSHAITLIATDTVTGCEHEKIVNVNIDNYHTFISDTIRHACDTLTLFAEMMFTDTFYNDPENILFHWDFGDGDTALTYQPNNPYVNHFYSFPGDYTITVTSVNDYGCPDTVTQSLSIHPSPIAEFSIEDPNLCPPYDVFVSDQSIAMDTAITSYQYLLTTGGDSSFFNAPNNSITLENAGPYLLQLFIEDGFGCADTSASIALAPHIINFSYDLPDFLCYNTDYELNNYIYSEFPPLDYYWEFGDGSVSEDSVPVINIDSTQSQLLTNYVTIVDSVGCTQTDTFYIEISVPTFTYNFEIDEAACPPIYSDFGIFSDDPIDFYTINYGDGESNIVNTAVDASNISHVYDTPGEYDVVLGVTDIYGCSASILVESMIYVPGPWASFTFSPNSGCPPLEVTFEILTSDNVEDYFWVFGDGYTSTEENPTHIFNLAGTYTPILVIQDAVDLEGDSIPCIVSIQGEDLIIDGPVLNFAVLEDTLCYGEGTFMELQNLTESIPGFDIISTHWDFGDGSESNDENPEAHEYTAPGHYTITLTVVTENGCEYILEKDNAVFVMPVPEIQPYAIYEPSCPPLLVNFYSDTGLVSDELDFLWDFGDNTTSNELNPIHQYNYEGEYQASLSVGFYSCVFNSTFMESFATNIVPEAIIEASPLYENGSLTNLQFINESIDEDDVEWLINGNVISTDNQITVSAQNDSAIVYLIAYTEFGCSDTTFIQLSDINWNTPNVISPNGDGINEYFDLNLEGFGPCIALQIYDRWGLLIYEDANYLNDWDGRHQDGKKVSDGTYFYIVDICGSTKLSGYITVLR